jgi:hypothetical protein
MGCKNNIHYLGEIENVEIHNGMMLSIGIPVRLDKFADRIPIAATNVSKDTIYFRNMFILASQHPVLGDIDLVISDKKGQVCSPNYSTMHYYSKMRLKSEFIVLPPGGIYKDVIDLNLMDHYNLKKGHIYTIFVRYANSLIPPTDFYPAKLPAGKLLWIGQLKSNTIKIRY